MPVAQNGLLNVIGTVQQVSKRGKRTALKVDGKWFSTFEELPPVERGDEVEIAYRQVEKNGRTYYDIEALRVARPRRADREAGCQAAREAHIDRSVALKAAANWAIAAQEADPETVLGVAERFMAWLQQGAPEASRESAAVPF